MDAWEEFRTDLLGYCYRMLGSDADAEDAVQEALLRAWRYRDRHDPDRAPLRTWVFSIATNVCLDMLRGAGRRARAVDLGPASPAGAALGAPLPDSAWVRPIPDHLVLPEGDDPAVQSVRRESIRLAFVAALQHLAPRQRAVLILREVLCWSAGETARVLGTTEASVNSALQRARAKLRAVDLSPTDPFRPTDPVQRRLLTDYCDAFERYDVDRLVALLHEDVTMSMPPFQWWLHGREQVRAAMLAAGQPCEGARLVPTVANGSPAFGQFRPAGQGYEPFALVVVDITGGMISDLTTYLDPRLVAAFDLPAPGVTPATVR